MTLYQDDGPVAGPSSRPWIGDARQDPRLWPGARHAREDEQNMAGIRRRKARVDKRQEAASSPVPEASPSPSSTVPLEVASSGLPSESPTPFSTSETASSFEASYDPSASPSPSPFPSSSASTRPPLFSGTRSETFQAPSSTTWSDSAPIYTSSSLPWSTRTRNSAPSARPSYVPGVQLNMTLGGDSDTEAVYAIPIELGHSTPDATRKRAPGDISSQLVNVQVDLGSSDMWLASGSCTSDSCAQSKMLFDDTQSLDSGVDVSINYQSGSVEGDIFWEQLTMGSFQIGYQAFISANTVTNQDLDNGNFTGVLGLAFPAASQIQESIPGTTSSNPDGATFLDNLFGSGAYAPTERIFSMALERREDVRTGSFFTIGEISDRLCPKPCSPNYIPIIPQSRLGSTGFVHWRIALSGVSATTWSDPENGVGPTVINVPLGPSFAESGNSSPLAVLDSGGVQILVSRRAYADSLYGAYGVSASSDGLYRLPCKTQLAFTFEFSGSKVPIHPLDMSYPDPTDPSQATCIGMIQYADNLGTDVGDFILGSSFLKNVYSIYQYPDQVRSTRWQPTIGLIPLTNASVASHDFYAVRSNRQSLRSVSSEEDTGGPGPWNPTASSPASNEGGGGGKKMASTAVIVGCSIVGFFVLAAAAFAAWWFWLRRRHGSSGVVEYKRKSRSGDSNHDSDYSGSTTRAKKHQHSQRQKSMIEGYSDFEGDSSWVSETGDSIRLGYIPEVAEDGEEESKARPAADMDSHPSQTRVLDDAQTFDEPVVMPVAESSRERESSPTGRRGSSPSARFTLAPQVRSSHAQSGPYPSLPKSSTARSLSVSMNGPFPSSQGNGLPANRRPDASPMYDINTSDYFQVPPARGRAPRGASGSRERETTPATKGINPANPFDTP